MNRRDVLLAAVAGIAGLLRGSRAAAGPAPAGPAPQVHPGSAWS